MIMIYEVGLRKRLEWTLLGESDLSLDSGRGAQRGESTWMT